LGSELVRHSTVFNGACTIIIQVFAILTGVITEIIRTRDDFQKRSITSGLTSFIPIIERLGGSCARPFAEIPQKFRSGD